ncbi:cache domain-containing protein [uncultured Roseobacter sp.]|uniref:cache domain-containing protein n=1 Tax=uncultured Roseobacter sp. TaxID=114847 RepID=UPI00260787A7|nr:cache domain-containing protein [uncultured Roseobacter sp.]
MKTSLGLVLAFCLAGLQFVAITIIMSSSYVTSERVLLNHARSLLRDVGVNTIAHSKGFLEPAKGAAELAARIAENRIIASDNRELLEQLLFQQLQTAPHLAGLFYGDQRGNFVYVKHSEEPAPFRSKIISRDGEDRETELIWRDHTYEPVSRIADPADTFDPRNRPWYLRAQTERTTVWTDPYIFFSSQNPGITIAVPVISDDGDVQGVVGVDIEISELSEFLSELKIGENGTALIVNQNGDVIAHPKPSLLRAVNTDGTFRFAGIGEIEDQIAQAAFGDLSRMDQVLIDTERYAEFSHRGADYVSTIMPTMSTELPWTIAVYAPEADFIGAIVQNRTRNIWIAALVSVLTGVVGLFLANYINRPVRAFAVRAALISQGEVDPAAPMPRTYKELERANTALTEEIMQRKTTEREYGQTFELSSRGMVQISAETGALIRVNSKFASIMGYEVEELLERNVADFLAPEDPALFDQIVDETLESGDASIEQKCVRKDGQSVWLRVNAIMIRDNHGKPLHIVATINDITKTRNTQKQIEKLNRDLSHLARGELLGQMAAGLAHELNQPLTAITQNADAALMTAGENKVQNEELNQILRDLDQQAHRAADIIKALRSFARKGEEWKTPFDLDALIDQTLHLVQAEATEHGVSIAVALDDLPRVLGIRIQIAQVIVNLLRNAIEAMAESDSTDRSVRITASVEKGFVKVSVDDTGPGVDPGLDLFSQFETSKADGMGLGLSICRSIIEAGGGRMWHEAGDPSGARFCFTVPVADK